MKKFISLVLLTLTLAITLTSCSSMKSYEKNLGDDYKVDIHDEDEIEELAETFDLDADDYGISAIMEAEDRDKGYYAYIIQCKSNKMAEELVDDLDDIVKEMNKYTENAKIACRNARRDVLDVFKKMKKDSTISEDDMARLEKDVQTALDNNIANIDKLSSAKEKEIMEV